MQRYKERLKKLQHHLKENSCDALLVEDPINLYYLTGQNLSLGILLVHSLGADLIVDGRYFEMCQNTSPFPVHLTKKTEGLLHLLSSEKLKFIKNIAFNSDKTTYSRFLELKKEMPNLSLKPLDSPVEELRSLKDSTEIYTLRQVAKLGSQGFDYVCNLLKEGITEAEVAAELEIFWKRQGANGIAFDPIIAFGTNSSMPHYHAGNNPLQIGNAVLIDIGVTFNHYHSDMTRVVYFGKPDPKILEIHEIVQHAQQAALALCRPNTHIGELDAAARGYISQKGYGENFSHSLGHGIGLEVHESPMIRNQLPYKDIPLQPGMAITIEPGIYLPGIGGVRLEDTIIITMEGHENLTNRPTEPLIVEI